MEMGTQSETGRSEDDSESGVTSGGNRSCSLSSGLVFGDYVLVRELSQSNGAAYQQRSVWLATDSLNQRSVALKLERSDGGEQGQQLRREFEQLRLLAHVQLPEVYAAGWEPNLGWAYIAMEFVDGDLLGDAFARLGAGVFADLLWQACNVLVFFHEGHGVVHGDLKPENIVVVTSGESPHLKLIDLGFAESTGNGVDGIVRGTRFFAAASVLRGEAPTEQSDLYALGVSFVFAITGERHGLDQLEEAVSHQICKIVNRMIREDEDTRYSSVREVLEDLSPLVPESRRLGVEDTLHPKFVGRETELTWLKRWTLDFKRTHVHSKVVVLQGESGIGKSRLLEEASEQAVEEGLTVLHGIASPNSEGVYQQLIGLLDSASMKFEVFETATEINRLRGRLEQAERRNIGGLFDSSADTGIWVDLLAQFARMSAEAPLLIVLDDIVRSNSTIIDFLAFAARDPKHSPIGFLVALADDDATDGAVPGQGNPALDEMSESSLFRHLKLDRLSASESLELVDSILGPTYLGAELCKRIAMATAGHPQFCAFSANSIVRASLRGEFNVDESLSREQPKSLADALQRELNSLSKSERNGVDRLSVLARKIPIGVVQKILTEGGADCLDGLIQIGVLSRVNRTTERRRSLVGSVEFTSQAFRHAVFNSLNSEDRIRFHRRAFDAWLREESSGLRSLELTDHGLKAGELELAMDTAPDALDYLLGNHLIRGAIDLAEQVLNSCGEEDLTGMQGRNVSERLGDAYRLTGDLSRSCAAYDRSVNQAEGVAFVARLMRKRAFVLDALGEHDRAIADLKVVFEQRELLEPEELVLVCDYLGKAEFRRGHTNEAEEWLRRGFEGSENPENDQTVSLLWINLGNLELGRNRPAEARRYLEHAVRLNPEGGDLHLRGRGLGGLGVLAMLSGQLPEARAALTESLEIKRRFGNRRTLAVPLSNLGQLDHWVGNYGPAIRKFEEALAIRVEVGDAVGEVMTRAHLAEVWMIKGDLREALNQAEQAISQSEGRSDEARVNALVSMSSVRLTLGQFNDAEVLAEAGLELARKSEAIGDQALLLARLGMIEHGRDSSLTKLSEHLEDALKLAREMDYPRVLASVLTSQANCYFAISDFQNSKRFAHEALELSERLGLRLLLTLSELTVGCIAIKEGAIDEASRRLHRAEEFAILLAVPELTWKVHFALGQFHREGGRDHRALKWLSKSLDGLGQIVEELRDPALEESYLGTHERASRLVSIEAWMGNIEE